jgi:hypothetical protein
LIEHIHLDENTLPTGTFSIIHCFVRLIEHIHLDKNTLPTGTFSLNASSFPCWKMLTSTILSASGGALMRL